MEKKSLKTTEARLGLSRMTVLPNSSRDDLSPFSFTEEETTSMDFTKNSVNDESSRVESVQIKRKLFYDNEDDRQSCR